MTSPRMNPVGVSSSPFLLNATLRHHLGNKFSGTYPELVHTLSQPMYVNDVVSGAEDEENAHRLYVESKDVLRKGGFNFHKFITNSHRLQEQINEAEGTLL